MRTFLILTALAFFSMAVGAIVQDCTAPKVRTVYDTVYVDRYVDRYQCAGYRQ